MATDHYDLTRIKALPEQIIPDELFPERTSSAEEVALRWRPKGQYFQQKELVDAKFDALFSKVNEPILAGVDAFVKRSISGGMFPNSHPRLHAATLMLDMQTSDHCTTFDLIERRVKRNSTRTQTISIQRIRSNLRRKRGLLELLELSIKKSIIFIMIEQAETLDTRLAETLVGNLYQRLECETSPTKVVMVLFCLSTRLQDLPFDSMGCFGKMETIKRDEQLDIAIIRNFLLHCQDILMKLHSDIAYLIMDCYLSIDASIANLRLMFKLCLHRHFSAMRVSPKLTPKDKSHIELAQRNHGTICDKLHLIYELMKSKDLWPDDVLSLYDELLSSKSLSTSISFYDNFKSNLKLNPDALLKRVRRAIEWAEREKCPHNDLLGRLKDYESFLDNNPDCDRSVSNFINELLKEAQALENPLTEYGHIYFKDLTDIESKFLDTGRSLKYFNETNQGSSPYFQMICNSMLDCPSQISANDLWYEMKSDLEEKIILDSGKRAKTSKKALKSTPRKKSRLDVETQTLNEERCDIESSGIAKSIFVDIVACLEHKHLIKLIRKGDKGLLIKRSFWLC